MNNKHSPKISLQFKPKGYRDIEIRFKIWNRLETNPWRAEDKDKNILKY
jgi:hypothetical protein